MKKNGNITTDGTVRPVEIDDVNHPNHYNSGNIEVIVMAKEIARPYSGDLAIGVGNVVKYLARAPFKGTFMKDLRKAQWYLNDLIKTAEDLKLS